MWSQQYTKEKNHFQDASMWKFPEALIINQIYKILFFKSNVKKSLGMSIAFCGNLPSFSIFYYKY